MSISRQLAHEAKAWSSRSCQAVAVLYVVAIAQNGVQDWTYFDPAGLLKLLSIMPGGAINTRGQLERLGIEVALHRNRIGQ